MHNSNMEQCIEVITFISVAITLTWTVTPNIGNPFHRNAKGLTEPSTVMSGTRTGCCGSIMISVNTWASGF